ncbi:MULTISPECIES: FliI/YscN family ATPase [Treponema]|uniref:FliI/YscN family ATPase n=1 Tax=Treponema TaxID=157 RepID=UPI003FD822DC
MEQFFDKYLKTVLDTETILYTGTVTAIKGLMIRSRGPYAKIGELCTIKNADGTELVAEVVGFDQEENAVNLMAYGDTKGIMAGSEVVASGKELRVPVGKKLLGRIIDALGRPYDRKGPLQNDEYYPAIAPAPDPYTRKDINRRIITGVRAIDSLLTCGKGQRLGIFAGSGVGKSTLLSMIARNTNADVNVIGLIGERGREVMDFIEHDLGPEGMKRSVVVVATGDQSSIARLRAAYTTTAVAEYFRNQGKDVMLMMDSVTRFCHAQREIGTANGEPPTQSGYPASVWDMLPKLLERTGTNDKGSITAFYTVLVDGDDLNEPVSDKVRGTLDGHIVLSKKLFRERHFPAIDITSSISRLWDDVTGPQTQQAANKVSRLISIYEENKDMINAGVYVKGSNPEIDEAIERHPAIEELLTQSKTDHCTIENTLQILSAVSGIEIPEDEYSEDAGLGKKTTAQLVQERKIDDVASSNELSNENMTAQTANSLEQAAKALGGLSKK